MEVGRRRRTLTLLRAAAGVVLVTTGVSGIFVLQGSAAHLGSILQAALAVLVGITLLAGPYLVRMTQDLSEERLMRIRAQERDLRAWLYKPEGTGKDEAEEPDTLAEAVRRNAAEVEDKHGVPIEVVIVGDCPLDERIGAQMQAAREAMVNAAKYGGEGGAVQVYAEVEGRTVFVSVRDRGPGFDLDAIPADRMGVRESIIGRMERNGGTARLRAVPDGGTEVELEMERAEKTS
jgi:signal transduction histidine kinase